MQRVDSVEVILDSCHKADELMQTALETNL